MNHCIPNRTLYPNNLAVSNGLVVTSALEGEYTHYVFRDKKVPLFLMPEELFQVRNKRGLRNTEILRREKFLEFGDNIYFTAEEPQHEKDFKEVFDYEKSLPLYEVACINGRNMVKTIAVLPPMEEQKQGVKCWTELFGMIDLGDMAGALYDQAEVDVPIFAWIQIEIKHHSRQRLPYLIHTFYEFIGIAMDDRKLVWETEWNSTKTNRPIEHYTYSLETTDDEAEEDLVEKKEEQILDIIIKHEGYLIGPKELFCPQLKDNCVHIGLWAEKHLCKPDNLPFGCTFEFDAYYNEIHKIYIAYYYKILTPCLPKEPGHNEVIYDDDEKVCSVFLDEDDPNNKLIQIKIMPTESFGALYYNPQFGLIADPYHVLGPMPIVLGDIEVEELWMNVEDTGPGKKLCRFFISESQDDETWEKINEGARLAENEDKSMIDFGFIVDAKGTFYCPRYPQQTFIFPKNQLNDYPAGYWTKFRATYNMERNQHDIVAGELAHKEKGIVPHNRLEYIENGIKQIKYQFKIDAELENNSNIPFMNGHLYNPAYGVIADPDGKFVKKKRGKKYKLIVEADQSEWALTLFKLVRMAKPNEKMESEKKNVPVPKQAHKEAEDNENTNPDGTVKEADDEDTNLLGIMKEEAWTDDENDNDVPQVLYLSDAQRRERAHAARLRRRKRDQEANNKQLKEQQRQLEEDQQTAGPSTSADS